MPYVCLIYDDEKTWAKMLKPETDPHSSARIGSIEVRLVVGFNH
jgi:hypothetical protein